MPLREASNCDSPPNIDGLVPFHFFDKDTNEFYDLQYWYDHRDGMTVYWQSDDEWRQYKYSNDPNEPLNCFREGVWVIDWMHRQSLTDWIACRQFVSA